MTTKPITEQQNPLTLNLDVADPAGFVRLLRQSDAQIFSGYEGHAAVTDEEMIEAMALVSWKVSRLLLAEDTVVLLSGAGTSGRLAHLLSQEFNRLLRERKLPEVFKPLIAGGEAALIQAQEFAEDSVPASVRDLQAAFDSEELTRGMYIGITCGLSAPYMAGQLDYLAGSEKFDTVVLGFNPVDMARDMPIEGWDKTVRQVIDAARQTPRFTMLNPVHGPEAITGSTRMKGGTLTKMVLEIVFATALEIIDNESLPEKEREAIGPDSLFPLRRRILSFLARYREAVFAAYGNVPALAELVRLGGSALRSSGRISYLGRGIAGVWGIIDASECPPTFGADLFDVHAYIREGWELLGHDPEAMRAKGKAYEIDHEYFEAHVIPDLEKGDLVVGIAVGTLGENTRRLLVESAGRKARTALLLVTDDLPRAGDIPEEIDHRCVIEVPSLGFAPGFHNEGELVLKLCLNALSSGAHTMAGKIYGNVMIDLRISNTKLYYRAIGLISMLAGVSQEEARRALHHAVAKKPVDDAEMDETSLSAFIQRSITRPRIVPLSILLATGKFTHEQAEERLSTEPRVRRIIEQVVGGE